MTRYDGWSKIEYIIGQSCALNPKSSNKPTDQPTNQLTNRPKGLLLIILSYKSNIQRPYHINQLINRHKDTSGLRADHFVKVLRITENSFMMNLSELIPHHATTVQTKTNNNLGSRIGSTDK